MSTTTPHPPESVPGRDQAIAGAAPAAPATGTDGLYAARWLVLAIVLCAEVMDLIDATIVNVAGPSIRRDLGGGATTLQWLGAAYTVTGFKSSARTMAAAASVAISTAAARTAASADQPRAARACLCICVKRVERTLLSAAFDFDFAAALSPRQWPLG